MFIATHKKIAAYAYDMISFSTQCLINKDSYIEGSYFPDTNIKYTVVAHEYKRTIGIVEEKIDEILSSRHAPDVLGRNLGIVSHFVADYCSPYHTNDKYRKQSLVKHLAYEKQTNDIVDKILNNINRFTHTQPYPLYFNTLSEDLKSFIQIDMQSQKCMEKEVTYAAINTIRVVNMIMDRYISLYHMDDAYSASGKYEIPSADYYTMYNISDDGMYEDADYL
ncbi:MAG: zinc dependent phospholipase C family protein [Eubacteriales bacterium]